MLDTQPLEKELFSIARTLEAMQQILLNRLMAKHRNPQLHLVDEWPIF
jgi:hypothetical protein